jgi:hypothetical protein
MTWTAVKKCHFLRQSTRDEFTKMYKCSFNPPNKDIKIGFVKGKGGALNAEQTKEQFCLLHTQWQYRSMTDMNCYSYF